MPPIIGLNEPHRQFCLRVCSKVKLLNMLQTQTGKKYCILLLASFRVSGTDKFS